MQMVVRNLMLADWFDEDHNESIMNPRRGKWSRELMENVRKACCINGQCDLEARPHAPCLCLRHLALVVNA